MPLVLSPPVMSSQGGFPPFSRGSPSMDSGCYSTSGDTSMYPSRNSAGYGRDFQAKGFASRPEAPIVYQSTAHGITASSRGQLLARDSPTNIPIRQPNTRDYPYAASGGPPSASSEYGSYSSTGYGSLGQNPRSGSVHSYSDWDPNMQLPGDVMMRDTESPPSLEVTDYPSDAARRLGGDKSKGIVKYHSQRRPSNRDEFDGPHQLLNPPSPRTVASQERDLPHLPTNLDVQEQDDILCKVNDRLSQCAFDFVAKYQFPIPVESDKRPVRVPADREWTEWVYLLKRLATKRRIPARVLYNNQIKQLVTVLENSLEMRHAAKHQSRPLKDDRNVLQLISAGTQVAKILKDAAAMDFLDHLYVRTEMLIQDRRRSRGFPSGA